MKRILAHAAPLVLCCVSALAVVTVKLSTVPGVEVVWPIQSTQPLVLDLNDNQRPNYPAPVQFIRVYANAGENIPAILIRGDLADTPMKVLLAQDGVQWPLSSSLRFNPTDNACVNWSGITFEDSAVRDRTILAAAISGELLDPVDDAHAAVEVGHIFRLQAGSITGNVYSSAEWAPFNQPNGVISALTAISGHMFAYGSITRVECGNFGSGDYSAADITAGLHRQ